MDRLLAEKRGGTVVRYAAFGDVHGNFKALEAALAYIERQSVDGIITLGDYVTDGPYPERTMQLLHEMRGRYPCYMVRGNREEYLLNNLDNHEGWKPSSANGTLYYTLRHVPKEDMDFFASLPSEREVRIEGCPILYICHGTPGRVRGNVHEEAGLKDRVLEQLEFPYLLGGHSHHQEVDRGHGKTYINPGSLGIAIDGVGRRAQFAVLTGSDKGWEAELLSIPYDVEGYLAAFAESGVDEIGLTLNKALKKSIVTGVNYFYHCIVAMEAEAKRQGVPSIAQMPEEDWRKLEQRFDL